MNTNDLDAAWITAHENAAELLFGVVEGVLTPEQDEACIEWADEFIAKMD